MLKKYEAKVRKFVDTVIQWSADGYMYDRLVQGLDGKDIPMSTGVLPVLGAILKTPILSALTSVDWAEAMDTDMGALEGALRELSNRVEAIRLLKQKATDAGYKDYKGRAWGIVLHCTQSAPLLLASDWRGSGSHFVEKDFKDMAKMYLDGLVSDEDVKRLFEEEWAIKR